MQKILIILVIFLFNGCCIKREIIKEIYLSQEDYAGKILSMRMDDAENSLKDVSGIKEWYFVNQHKLYTCGFYGGTNSEVRGGCTVGKLFNSYEETYKNWFSHYITLDKLEKKWKNKPMPEYLKKSEIDNRMIIR